MLDWLGNLSQKKTDHPMHSVEEAARLLTGLSDEPLKALEEITSWLTTLTQAHGFQPATRLAVIRLVDETGQPYPQEITRKLVTDRTLTPFERQQQWDALMQYWQRVEHTYRFCLDEMQQGGKQLRAQNPDCALALVRAMRALVQQMKLRQLRYLFIGEPHWQSVFEILRLAEDSKCDLQRVTAYPDDSLPTTVRYELMRVLLLVLARPESMTPRETEIAARIASRYADACIVEREPREGLMWEINPALPRGPELATPPYPAGGAYFVGTSAVIAKIQELVRRLNADQSLKEQHLGEEFSREEKLAVLARVVKYWGEFPPRAREYRTTADALLDVTRGFVNACRRISRVQYRDWTELVAGLEVKLLAKLYIVVDPDAPPPPVPTEQWQQRENSVWGLSADVARTAENEVTIGTLCAFRTTGLWWVGTIRRLVRDADDRLRAGIEVFAKKPATLLLRRIGHGGMSVAHHTTSAEASAGDYMNTLLLGSAREEKRRHEILLPRGEFIAGFVYEAMIGEARQHFKVEELLERGADFDRVRFTRVKSM